MKKVSFRSRADDRDEYALGRSESFRGASSGAANSSLDRRRAASIAQKTAESSREEALDRAVEDHEPAHHAVPKQIKSAYRKIKSKKSKFFSQPNPEASYAKVSGKTMARTRLPHSGPVNGSRYKNGSHRSGDHRAAISSPSSSPSSSSSSSDHHRASDYVLFETRPSARIKQLSHLLSRKPAAADDDDDDDDDDDQHHQCGDRGEAAAAGDPPPPRALPSGRYFDALKGPELETLKVSIGFRVL
jgi:hypothetical protein